MTELLEEAFVKAARLPDHEQDAFARWLMGELESERRWSGAFETSQGQLAELAREALEDDRAGRTEPLGAARAYPSRASSRTSSWVIGLRGWWLRHMGLRTR